MNPVKRSLRAFALLIGSYAVLTFIYVLPVDNVFMLHNVVNVLYFAAAIILYLYFTTRIIDRRVRHYLGAVGIMIIFWCILRAAKYIAFKESESIARMIWYLYYVPMFAIPQFSFQAALSLGKAENEKLPVIQKVTGIIAVVCIMIVLTNDFHQMVFRFHPGFVNWDADYLHQPLFWIICVWDYLFFAFTALILLRKCRLSASRRLTWIPLIYLGLGVLGLYLVNIDKLLRIWGTSIGEFPEISCYTLGGFWILCITIGLVPSNQGYETLLQASSLAAQITDINQKVIYQGRNAVALTKEALAIPGTIKIDDNTIVQRKPISGGFVYWQTDITELNEINQELQDAKERIEEERKLIQEANRLKEKRAQIDAKSKVYDEIAVRVLPQSQQIAILSAQVEEDASKFENNMRLISIYSAYIKRLSNMMLIGQTGMMKKQELLLAFLESARYLNKAGILTKVDGRMDDQELAAVILIRVYEQFEALLEEALSELKALHIVSYDNVVKLTFEGGGFSPKITFDGYMETDDDVTFVSMYLREEGEQL